MDRKSNLILNDESGVALIVALLMIVMISLIGLASSSNTTFEIRLSGNKRAATDAFYTADAGVQGIKADINNFILSNGYVEVPMGNYETIPFLSSHSELKSQSAGLFYLYSPCSSSVISPPEGVSFSTLPQVNIVKNDKANPPRGLGLSAINFQYGYYFLDVVGTDQIDLQAVRAQCEIMEKMVRLIPIEQ